jgi:2-oxoglutarate ferredoxin oxidoreductase subunit alpha
MISNTNKKKKVKVNDVIIKFAGDSGDGIQLTGSQFSDVSALSKNEIITFNDYPSEIRAPEGTLGGISGFQVRLGNKRIKSPGDKVDVLVAMNPAALKKNLKWIKKDGIIIIDIDNFDNKHYKKAGYIEDPLHDGSLKNFKLIKAPITNLTISTLKDFKLPGPLIDKIRSQFVAGILYWLFNKDLSLGEQIIKSSFINDEILVEANTKVLKAGYSYAETIEAFSNTFEILPIKNKSGLFRRLNGNIAASLGLIAAANKAGIKLFLGSYPITPASEILHELSKRKDYNVISFQAEDEIAAVCSALGASYSGSLGITATSGPGLALMSETIALAVMVELPLVIIDVQRGGPSTGLPTKTEQSDLYNALYGRSGEAPLVVLAASSPANCFYYAYQAAKISLEHLTPVILLSDAYLANGTELWSIPDFEFLPEINPPFIEENEFQYQPYLRNPLNLVRFWALPGQKDFRHRIGGLEKQDITGEISENPVNHERMTIIREEKVQIIKNEIEDLRVEGHETGDLLVVGWGGTYGSLTTAVKELQNEGKNISLAHFNYIKPLPKNTCDIFKNFKKIVVCELNMGQFASYLQSNISQFNFIKYNKIQGLPFMISELKQKFTELLND